MVKFVQGTSEVFAVAKVKLRAGVRSEVFAERKLS